MPSEKGTLLDDCCFKEMREGEGGSRSYELFYELYDES